MSGEIVGYVADSWVHPFKGKQGVRMGEIVARSVSIVGDRRVAFTEINSKGTPTLLDTVKFPGLLRYKVHFDDPLNPKESEIVITAPEGDQYSANDPLLLERVSDESGRKLAILRMGRGLYHSMPVSLMTLGTIRQTAEQAGVSIDPRVFRENLYIETTAGIPYEEDSWLGKMLIFGDGPDSAKLFAVKLDPRCATVNMHPETGEQDSRVLKAIVKNHNNNLGIYCAIIGEGKIQVGSPVYLAEFR